MKQVQIYFQTQQKFNNLCLLHSINNLLGQTIISENHLESYCSQLSNNFFNPHKHFLGGDYDANVLMLALQNLGLTGNWLDNREEQKICLDSMILKEKRKGYIINKQFGTNWFKKSLGMSDRHWIAIRLIDEIYYELDSKKKTIQIINRISDYLKNQIKSGSHIIEVVIAKTGNIQTEEK